MIAAAKTTASHSGSPVNGNVPVLVAAPSTPLPALELLFGRADEAPRTPPPFAPAPA